MTEFDLYVAEARGAYSDLSDCYEKTGNFDKALSAYKISSKISDSIRGKENIKKATELTLKYEFQKSQQKIQDEQQKKNDLAKARQTALLIGLILTFILAVVAYRGFRNKRRANHLLHAAKRTNRKYFVRITIHAISSYPIRKDGIPWRINGWHCP